MPFRVPVIGPPAFRDYPHLRDVLDVVLANRVPDVELLTVGGSGLPFLVASYARMFAAAALFFWYESGGECYLLAREMKAREKPVHIVTQSTRTRSTEPPRAWHHRICLLTDCQPACRSPPLWPTIGRNDPSQEGIVENRSW